MNDGMQHAVQFLALRGSEEDTHDAHRFEDKDGPAIVILARKHFKLDLSCLQSTLRETACQPQFENDIYNKVQYRDSHPL